MRTGERPCQAPAPRRAPTNPANGSGSDLSLAKLLRSSSSPVWSASRLLVCESVEHADPANQVNDVVSRVSRTTPWGSWLASKDSNLRSPDPEDCRRFFRWSRRFERGADSISVRPAGNQVEHAERSQVNVIRQVTPGPTVSRSTTLGKGAVPDVPTTPIQIMTCWQSWGTSSKSAVSPATKVAT